ncbi:hypothetical protein IQ249_22950 [Lusitaniella coriacea LEGE 07157]|uniref:Uncharacterized protein n=1 Tax=Lusitaniella coriacea LEGE 07157 TaxID=945747 RepID=A0A8J7E2V1_9CYAN|nr:hypothetical protein [Lusitaniella coriacea]MBE9118751.1 hypothetical protein [Lusitaniella coriacea LEGE 07157]
MPDLTIFKTILHQLTQPTAIAIFGSVGLHAALGVTLPILPIFSQDSDIPRNVRLMELTPAEQLRLPNVSPETALPFGQFPDATAVLPLSEKFDLPSSSSKLPDLPAMPDLKSNPAYNYPLSTPSKTVLRGRSTRSFPTGRTRTRTSRRVGSRLPSRQGRSSARNNTNLRFDSRFKPRTDLTPGEALRIFGKVGQAPQPPHNSSENEIAALRREANPQTQTSETNAGEQENNQVATGGTHTLSLNGVYPRAACASQSNGSVVYRVTSSGGKSAKVYQVRGANNPLFSIYAYRSLASQNFSEPGTYNVTVNFNYNDEACGSVANQRETPQPLDNEENPSRPERETPQPRNTEETPSRPERETPQPRNTEETPSRPERETPQPRNTEETPSRPEQETPQPRNTEETPSRPQRETPQPRNTEETPSRPERETPQPRNTQETPSRSERETPVPQPSKKKPQPSNTESSTESEGESGNQE